MKLCRVVVLATILFLGHLQPVVVRAANIPYSLSVTPFAGGYLSEGNQNLEHSAVYGLAFGYNLSENWALEAVGTFSPDVHSTTTPPKQTVNLYGVRGDILYHFLPEQRFVPYAAAGGGVLFLDPRKGSSDEDALVDIGAGFKFFLTDYVAVRGDVRYLLDFNTNDINRTRDFYNNFAYTAGLTFQLGGVQPAASPVAVAKPAPAVKDVPPEPAIAKSAAEVEPTPAPVPPAVPTPVKEVSGEVVEKEPVTLLAGKQSPADKVTLTGITIVQDGLEISSTGPIRNYEIFRLSQPSRLVIDINDVVNGLGTTRVPVYEYGILAVRVGNHPDFVRIVLDTAPKELPYRIMGSATGLKVILLPFKKARE